MKHHFFVSEIPGYDAVFYFRRKVVAENGTGCVFVIPRIHSLV